MSLFIENYSDKYNLQLIKSNTHGYTKVIQNVTNVPKFSEKLAIFDNGITHGRGIYGSISWKIMRGNKPWTLLNKNNLGKRLVLTYRMPF